MVLKEQVNFVRLYCLLIPKAACTLRRTFRQKWKQAAHGEWVDTEIQGDIFRYATGSEVLRTASTCQKKLLTSGNVELWDLKLLCHVLLKMNFGTEILSQKEKTELQLLEKERKKIVYCKNQMINEKENNQSWQEISKIIINFGCSALDLIHIKYIDLKPNMEIDRQLQLPFKDKIPPERFKRFANSFIEEENYYDAIYTYTEFLRLPIPNLSPFDKAFVYLARSKTAFAIWDLRQIKFAKYDAKRALQLRPTWVDTYQVLTAIYEAIGKGWKARRYGIIAETLDVLRKVEDCKYKAVDDCTELIPEYWDENDDWLIAEEICKSAIEGEASGLYNLALMMSQGTTYVTKNSKQATQLLFEAAAKPVVLNGKLNPNVAKAELALGYCSENGYGGLSIDLVDAVIWYNRAIKHGHVASCDSLAKLHYYKRGDKSSAIKFWELGARHGNFEAMNELIRYYLNEGDDIDKANEWYQKGVMGKKELAEKYGQLIKDRQEKKVKQHEENKGKNNIANSPQGVVAMPQLRVLDAYVMKGCLYAHQLKQAVAHFTNAKKLLHEFKCKAPSEFVHELAHSIRLESTVVALSVVDRCLTTRVVGNVLRKGEEICDLDKDARICHAYFHASAHYDMEKFLWKCVEKYPGEVVFRVMLSNVLASLGRYNVGVEVADVGLNLFPKHWDLLSVRARNVTLGLVTDKEKVIDVLSGCSS